MKQVICDKCKKVLKEEDFDKIIRVDLPYLFSAKAWQYKTFDLCNECAKELDELIGQAKYDFISKE